MSTTSWTFRDRVNPEIKPQPHDPQPGTALQRGQSCPTAVSRAEMRGSWEAVGQNPKRIWLAHLALNFCRVQAWQCCVRSTSHPGFGGSLLAMSASNTCQVTSRPCLKDPGRKYWVGRYQEGETTKDYTSTKSPCQDPAGHSHEVEEAIRQSCCQITIL